jgi:hypothetical protein
MILLISSFITHDRPSNRHNRLDVLMMTLKSYSRLTWSEVHLYLKLDLEFESYKPELELFIKRVFLGTKVELSWTRIERQEDWQPIISKIVELNELIWFSQNDDHPFIDHNTDLITEGIQLLKDEPHEYASIYLSHWPEILKLAGKNTEPELKGGYLVFDGTLLDSIQIVKPKFLHYIFFEINWNGIHYKRIDELLRQRAIWGEIGNTDVSLQKIYVPLREQCRKFMAYSHVHMKSVTPLAPSYELAPISRSAQDVGDLIFADHKSFWTENNDYILPINIVEIIQELYGNRSE